MASVRSASQIVMQLGKYGAGAGLLISSCVAEQEGSNSSIIAAVRSLFVDLVIRRFYLSVMFYLRHRLLGLNALLASAINENGIDASTHQRGCDYCQYEVSSHAEPAGGFGFMYLSALRLMAAFFLAGL